MQFCGLERAMADVRQPVACFERVCGRCHRGIEVAVVEHHLAALVERRAAVGFELTGALGGERSARPVHLEPVAALQGGPCSVGNHRQTRRENRIRLGAARRVDAHDLPHTRHLQRLAGVEGIDAAVQIRAAGHHGA